MNFDQWKDAVAQALAASNRGFGVGQIDPQDLQNAFNANVSPVIFARQATPSAPGAGPPGGAQPLQGNRGYVPLPSAFVVKVTAGVLGGVGWFCWVFAVFIVFIWMLSLFGVAVGSKDSDDAAAAAAGWLFFLGPLAVLWALWFLVIGGVWHYLAQRLLLAWHSR